MFLRFATRLWGVCDFPNFMLVSCAVFPCFTARIFQTSQLATKSLLCWLHSSPLGCLKSLRLHGYHTFLAPWRPDARAALTPPGDATGGHFADGERLPSSSAQVGFISGAGWKTHGMKNDPSIWGHRGLELCTMYQKFWVIYIYIYTLYVELMLII